MTTHRSYDMTDTLREARSRVTSLLRQAGYPDAAEYVASDYMIGEMERAARAAAPQPAPVDREALVEAFEIAMLSVCDGNPDLRKDAEERADALLARGLHLPGGEETMAWQDFADAPLDGTPILIDENGYSVSVRWKSYDEELAVECGAPGYWAYSDALLADVVPGGPEVPFRWLPDPAAIRVVEGGDDAT